LKDFEMNIIVCSYIIFYELSLLNFIIKMYYVIPKKNHIYIYIYIYFILFFYFFFSFGHYMRKILLIEMVFGKGLIASHLQTKVQVKGLTHMFCL